MGGHSRRGGQHKDTTEASETTSSTSEFKVVGLGESIEHRESSGPGGRQERSKPGPDLGGLADLTKRVYDRNDTELAVKCAERTMQS